MGSSTPSSSSWNGSGSERETISSSSTWISTSPVGMFGFTASGARRTTSPRARTTNSERMSCAICAASGRALGVDHELHDARVVAEVDEDEAAVVSAARDPAGHGELLPDVIGADLAGIQVAPGVHPEILSTSSSSGRRDVGAARLADRCLAAVHDHGPARAEPAGLGELSLDRPAGVVHVRPEPTPP